MNKYTLKISKMTGKLSGIQAINTNTLSNEFCLKQEKLDSVCKECYSFNMLRTFRASCIDSWESNSSILSRVIIPEAAIEYINASIFRLSGHGELINSIMFINFLNLAKANSATTFSLWTKRLDIVSKVLKTYALPPNLIMIYSNPSLHKVISKPPKHFEKVFNVSLSGEVNPTQTKCTGVKCIECRACYEHNDSNCIVEKLK